MSEFHDVECHAHSTDPISLFRQSVGITDVSSVKCSEKRLHARNIGVYKRVLSGEKTAKIQYHIYSVLINAFFLLQLAFAAILTALGAAGASHVAITVFGVLNTTLAAFLSFAKGRGLPTRFRQQQWALRRVREHIEQKEREFSGPGCALDIQEEVKIVIALYDATKANSIMSSNCESRTSRTYSLALLAPKLSVRKLARFKKLDLLEGGRMNNHTTHVAPHDEEILRQVAERMMSGNSSLEQDMAFSNSLNSQ